MKKLVKQIEQRIDEKYGSKKAWFDKHKIHSQRFYNFTKGKYNPTILTLNSWLKTLDLELIVRNKK